MNYYRYKTLRAIALTRFWNCSIFITLILFSLMPSSADAQQFVEVEDLEREESDLDEQTRSSSQPGSGLPLTDSEKLSGDVLSSVDSFIDEVYEEISPIIDSVKSVYAEINSEINGVVTTVLGEIGLANPQAESNNVGWTEQSPHYNPQTPIDVARRAEAADAQKAQVLEQLAQVIFGKRGQEVINQQNVLLGETQTVSGHATAAMGNTSQVSTEHAVENVVRAGEIARQTDIASDARVTQDVMKAIAAQNEEIAFINIGISEQLALLGEGQLYNGIQMNGLNTQLTIANQRSQNMETFLAAQSSQLAEIDSNQELAMKREIERENQARSRDRQGMTRIFIPGLFESDAPQATAIESNPSSTLPEQQSVNTFFSNLSDNLNQ